jgi:hypothetical protein
MDIRRIIESAPLRLPPSPLRPVSDAEDTWQSAHSGDHFQNGADQAQPQDAPCWLSRMSTDRLTRRQYLDKAHARKAARFEQVWIQTLLGPSLPAAEVFLNSPTAPGGAAGLAVFQSFVDDLVAAANAGFTQAGVVWLPGKLSGRGQFVFRLERNLIQLSAKESPATTPRVTWLETVAHETFHHFQQELITAHYRGEDAGSADLNELAAYYADARAVYQGPSAHMTQERHRKQALEVGAWTFGAALARIAVRAKG